MTAQKEETGTFEKFMAVYTASGFVLRLDQKIGLLERSLRFQWGQGQDWRQRDWCL